MKAESLIDVVFSDQSRLATSLNTSLSHFRPGAERGVPDGGAFCGHDRRREMTDSSVRGGRSEYWCGKSRRTHSASACRLLNECGEKSSDQQTEFGERLKGGDQESFNEWSSRLGGVDTPTFCVEEQRSAVDFFDHRCQQVIVTSAPVQKHKDLSLEIVEIYSAVEPVSDLRAGFRLGTGEAGGTGPITNCGGEAWLRDMQVDLPGGKAPKHRIGQLECALTHAVGLHSHQPSSNLRAGNGCQFQEGDGMGPNLSQVNNGRFHDGI